MSFRLYESAWVRVEGTEEPLQAHKDKRNAGVFVVGQYHYDVDARALPVNPSAPPVLSILSLQDVRDAGLRNDYNRDMGGTSKSGNGRFG